MVANSLVPSPKKKKQKKPPKTPKDQSSIFTHECEKWNIISWETISLQTRGLIIIIGQSKLCVHTWC